jgi:hypothetical protein
LGFIAIASVAAGIAFLAIAAIVGIRLADAFLFALGVVVALVPEGLLPTLVEYLRSQDKLAIYAKPIAGVPDFLS